MINDIVEGEKFTISVPYPLNDALRSGIYDVYGFKRGNLQKTFWEMIYDWLEKNQSKFSDRTKTAFREANNLDLSFINDEDD